MKKYILISVDDSDRICNGVSHETFNTLEEAQGAMRKEVEKSAEDIDEELWEEGGFEGWEDTSSETSAFIPSDGTGYGEYYWEIIEVEF